MTSCSDLTSVHPRFPGVTLTMYLWFRIEALAASNSSTLCLQPLIEPWHCC